jgi:hypothetical protein
MTYAARYTRRRAREENNGGAVFVLKFVTGAILGMAFFEICAPVFVAIGVWYDALNTDRFGLCCRPNR